MRRKYVYDPKSREMVEVTHGRRVTTDSFVRTEMHFKTTDGVEITSRKARDEYMRKNNLVDYEPATKKPESPRERERQLARVLSDVYESRRDRARANGERFFGRR